jgi:hypothetical protein
MALHVRRKWRIVTAGSLLIAVATVPRLVEAGTANFYSTNAATGTENYALITNAGGVAVPEPIRLISACNYNSGAAEVVMVFDASALPVNGAVPKMELPLPASGGTNAPSCASFSLPASGVTLYKGLVIAASTSGKTLTVDTTAGGNTFFEVGR